MAEHTNAIFLNEEINVKNEVFGFMSMPIKIPKSASKSKYFLEFKFIDAKGNAGAHSICFYPAETDSLKTKGVFILYPDLKFLHTNWFKSLAPLTGTG
ncbi:hypothetical protein [Pseudomonas sp. OHS18]|uniref:hypothetical protein n=1 Tax=Pseudomonas sp. OHS18 TaxID=3399679 RepID=UPI003A86FDF3